MSESASVETGVRGATPATVSQRVAVEPYTCYPLAREGVPSAAPEGAGLRLWTYALTALHRRST